MPCLKILSMQPYGLFLKAFENIYVHISTLYYLICYSNIQELVPKRQFGIKYFLMLLLKT